MHKAGVGTESPSSFVLGVGAGSDGVGEKTHMRERENRQNIKFKRQGDRLQPDWWVYQLEKQGRKQSQISILKKCVSISVH